MTDDEFVALLGAPHEQPAHAQACIELFEKDWGRRATSTLELRHWANLQGEDSLRFRLARRARADAAWAKACRLIWERVPAPLAPRAPLGQRICVTLAEAAQLTDRAEAELLACIRQGDLAAVKDVLGQWHIDRGELLRVFAPPGARAQLRAPQEHALDAARLLADLGVQGFVPEAAPRPPPYIATRRYRERVGPAFSEAVASREGVQGPANGTGCLTEI